ncbi:hypothetical protein RR46_04756 [Papilio xuthus]|uniref:Uncharacterized protein n=1 Tax=Papilio xuthus TaxID=66420 RepID=A0A194Q2J2_PAPXU|nr:hypothetical protein RR46_04756 [Papilio xuthus]
MAARDRDTAHTHAPLKRKQILPGLVQSTLCRDYPERTLSFGQTKTERHLVRRSRNLQSERSCITGEPAAPANRTASPSAAVAPLAAENAKACKYRGLGSEYHFVPFGVETLGPWGPSTLRLFKDISKKIIDITGDRRVGSYLGQRISLAVQRGNAASMFGTLPKGTPFNHIF